LRIHGVRAEVKEFCRKCDTLSGIKIHPGRVVEDILVEKLQHPQVTLGRLLFAGCISCELVFTARERISSMLARRPAYSGRFWSGVKNGIHPSAGPKSLGRFVDRRIVA